MGEYNLENNFVTEKNSRIFSITAAVLFILSSLLTGSGFYKFFNIVFSIVLSVSLFMNRKSFIAAIGSGGFALLAFISLARYFSLLNLLSFLGYGAFFVLILIESVPELKLDKNLDELPAGFRTFIAFIPAIIILLSNLISIVNLLRYAFEFLNLFEIILRFVFCVIINIAAILLTSFWVCSPFVPAGLNSSGAYSNSAPASFNPAQTAGGSSASAASPKEEGYYDLAMHVILLLVTCGIWQLIWVYRTTAYLNRCPEEEYREPVNKLLLYIFVPFYSIYWTYKSAQRVDKMAVMSGIASDISTLCLILSIFIPIVPPILMQMKINAFTAPAPSAPNTGNTYTYNQPRPTAPTGYTQPNANPANTNPVNTNPVNTNPVNTNTGNTNTIDTAEEIKKYKELFDSGAITEEEYNEMKKRLLGL